MMDISLAQEPIELSPNDISYVEKLGGRASDLDVVSFYGDYAKLLEC